MTRWNEGFEEFNERPDEYLNEQDPELIDFKEMEIPDVSWAKEIEKIEDPKLREKEIEIAEDIKQRESVLHNEAPRRKRTGYQSGLESVLYLGGHVVSPQTPLPRTLLTASG